MSETPPAAPAATAWLPASFRHPTRVDLGTGHHLRPIRATDVDLDMPAVMGSQPRLWSIYGKAWAWPPEDMTAEQDREDLARHEAEIEAHESFNYALFDEGETALLGCVYIDPPEKPGAGAEVSWWVVDDLVGSPVEEALDDFVPRWLADSWPIERPRFVGRDLTWDEWLALPDLAAGPSAATAGAAGHAERAERLRALYQAFNERDLDAVIDAMSPEVDWPNGWEGGRLAGRDDVRRYWERQWADIRPSTKVTEICDRPDGALAVHVRQVVRDPVGTVLDRSDVVHVYEFEGTLVRRMHVERSP